LTIINPHPALDDHQPHPTLVSASGEFALRELIAAALSG
jgi:hypothetical protein